MSETAYDQLGVSADKTEVHAAVAGTDPGLFPGAFCRLGEDVLGGDPDWCAALHADDAGTKVLVAYLVWRETGDASVFRGIAHDALVMNLDDLLCVGATGPFVLSNTINRNSVHVSGEVLAAVIAGFGDSVRRLGGHGIRIVATGGETADMGDAVRTLIVGANLAVRMPRSAVIDNANIAPGCMIVGLSSTGQATYEDRLNSGIGDNGLTLARHALLHHDYARTFPESLNPDIAADLIYRGPFRVGDEPEGLGMSVGAALLSPTRSYAPVVRDLLVEAPGAVVGMVHCTGGGQTKCLHFGRDLHYVKDDLFPVPPLFDLIRTHGAVPTREMYRTFNMGHRMELFLRPDAVPAAVAAAAEYGIDARRVGEVRPSAGGNRLTLHGPDGTHEYESPRGH